ncbi:short-chain dehydrogenase/reductase SDR [Pterulicium gracile]|uniref:Short-chain dehydrogenase/reductase SDR n=1 Tax=Pterulicium gracile TaxID=1884261 RepID=A0A5C3QKB3_9AGAR|nr:short-chain dehydrogenase/reductase SDR [Pterula gracilis]
MTANTIVITGASSGIGRTTAITFSKAGWNVVLTARRIDALQETLASCANSDAACLLVPGDVTNEEFVSSLFAQAVVKFGRVDVLFNNAGASAPATPWEELSLESFQFIMNVNVVGPFLCTREAVKLFKKQEPQGGRIINNGSISAHVPRPLSAPYTTSKHAIAGLTKSTALDGRAFGITCTQLDIGNAVTPLLQDKMGEGALQPNGSRMVEATFDPQYVADTVLYIASLPGNVAVLEMNIMAAEAPLVGRG